MKNILRDRPKKILFGRLKFSTKFIEENEIRGKKVLDMGCGYGWFESYALSQGVKKICGIEIAESDFRSAVRYIKDKRADFKVGNATEIPYPDDFFDTVVSWEVIEHIPKDTEDKMFKEVRRVLKDKGSFYLSTPYDSFWAKYFDPAWWIVGHRHYSKNKLISLGKRNKMKTIELHVNGRFWNLFNIINLYVSKWIFRSKPFFESFFNNKEDEEFQNDNGFMGIFVKYKKIE